MANGTSKVQDAQQKMTSVSGQFGEARQTVLEWIKHFEAEKARLEGQMGGSHGDDVAARTAEIDQMLEALRQGETLLGDLEKKAAEVEARL